MLLLIISDRAVYFINSDQDLDDLDLDFKF
jgi:hypothetical protein